MNWCAHDLAHIMARAVQEIWPETKVTIGPVIKDGWYYDFDRAEPFSPEDLGLIEKKMKEIINKRDPVRTEVWDRPRAIAFYEANNEPYKVELIDAIPGDEPLADVLARRLAGPVPWPASATYRASARRCVQTHVHRRARIGAVTVTARCCSVFTAWPLRARKS